MNKTIFIIIGLLALTINTNAGIRWPFGSANTVSGGVNDTVDISSELKSGLNYYTISNDTNMVINVTTIDTEWRIGDILLIEVTEGTAVADTIRYGTNITGTYDALPSGKTKVVTFNYNGTAWLKTSVNQID